MDNPHKVSPVTHEPPLADAVPGDQFPKPCNDEEHLDLHDESEETFMDQAQWHHSSPASQQLTFCGHPIHLPQAPQFFQHQANATINGGTSGAGCSGVVAAMMTMSAVATSMLMMMMIMSTTIATGWMTLSNVFLSRLASR
jgi:hypothetical protein